MADDDYLFDNRAEQAGDRFDALAAMFDPITRNSPGAGGRHVRLALPRRRCRRRIGVALAGRTGRPDGRGRRHRSRRALDRGSPASAEHRGPPPRRHRRPTGAGRVRPDPRTSRPRAPRAPRGGPRQAHRCAPAGRLAGGRGLRHRPLHPSDGSAGRRRGARHPTDGRRPHAARDSAAPIRTSATSCIGCSAAMASSRSAATPTRPTIWATSPATSVGPTSSRSPTTWWPRTSRPGRRSTGYLELLASERPCRRRRRCWSARGDDVRRTGHRPVSRPAQSGGRGDDGVWTLGPRPRGSRRGSPGGPPPRAPRRAGAPSCRGARRRRTR